MRFFSILFLALALLAPLPVSAEECSVVGGTVRFDAQPRDAAVGSSTNFSLRFQWNGECTGGVQLTTLVIDNFAGTDYEVRRRNWDMESFRGTGEHSFDFAESWISTPGQHRFLARILLDDRQITQSAVVGVNATGEGGETTAGGGPTTSTGGLTAPQVGPLDLSVAIGSFVRAETIAQYIAAVYNWAIGVAVTLAMVMVVVGGFQYLTSRGNPNAVGAAKGRIANAVIGLILALGSYVILNTINPQLVQLRNLTIPPIVRSETVSNRCEDVDLTQFAIAPDHGNCGASGTVSGRSGQEVATPECRFTTCPAAQETCTQIGGAYRCISCATTSDDDLEPMGLSVDTAGCRRLRPPNIGNDVFDCILSEDNTLDLNDDVCALVVIDCGSIEACEDYEDHATARHGDTTIPLYNMTIDSLVVARSDDAFANICNSNACEVAGGCHAEAFGVAWDCEAGPAAAGGTE